MKRSRNRRSYKNIIAITIASFTSIALISTGLAAFVLVRESSINASGNITVGDVIDNDITLTITSGAVGNLVLDAEKNDNQGRIQWDGTNYEVLAHDVAGEIALTDGNRTLDNVDLKYRVIVKGKTSGSVVTDDFVTDFMTNPDDRLALDGTTTAFDTPIVLSIDDSGNGKDGTFGFTFKFKWGAKYNGTNPSVYYDTPAASGGGADESIDVAKTELEALKVAAANYVFDIQISASFKASAP